MTENKKQIEYIVLCVGRFAEHYNLSLKDAFNFLFKYKGIEFLKEFYEIEHTLSLEDCVEDMLRICKNNGGSI